jgi:transcriptional regulator with XRE-family HTH domain
MRKKRAMPRAETCLAVARLRRALNMTQAEFAEKLGVAQSLIGRYETTHVPGLRAQRLFYDLAKELGEDVLAEIFAVDLEREDREQQERERLAQIASPHTQVKVRLLLIKLWTLSEWFKSSPLLGLYGHPFESQNLKAAELIKNGLLELADLILLEKRKGLLNQ